LRDPARRGAARGWRAAVRVWNGKCVKGDVGMGEAERFTSNATSLYQDVKNSAKDLRNHSLTSNDLHTFCNVLFVDDGSMQSSLPTPDQQATHLLNRAYRDFATAAVECYSANVVPADRTRALAMLSNGAAAFSEARVRVSALAS
jgi:hypothetical protein